MTGAIPRDIIVYCWDHGGFMKYNFAMMTWHCAGFDGEGCPLRLTDEEAMHILDVNGAYEDEFPFNFRLERGIPIDQFTITLWKREKP